MFKINFKLSTIATLFILSMATAHMEMRAPPPRRSKFNPDYQALGDIDNDMPAPLGDDFPYPCRGTKPGPIFKKYKAGENIEVKLGGNAPHNGGHCQFALSYDGGEKWIVFHDIIKNCMPSKTGPIEFLYTVPLPADAPTSDSVVFSWNWINASGEREFYMNCIDISIEGSSATIGMKGKELLVVNLPNFPTIDEFARPNQDYGSKLINGRKNITMFADGKVIPTVNSPAAAAPAPAPVPAPVPAPAPAPAPVPAPAPAPAPPAKPVPVEPTAAARLPIQPETNDQSNLYQANLEGPSQMVYIEVANPVQTDSFTMIQETPSYEQVTVHQLARRKAQYQYRQNSTNY